VSDDQADPEPRSKKTKSPEKVEVKNLLIDPSQEKLVLLRGEYMSRPPFLLSARNNAINWS